MIVSLFLILYLLYHIINNNNIQPNYVRTIEDEVELQRQQKLRELKEKGIQGTKVTPETFKAWQERKRKAKEEAARKLVDAELKKKKGGKGLSVLSGRELFNYKKELFDGNFDEDENNNKGDAENNNNNNNGEVSLVDEEDNKIQEVAEKVKSDLFLDGDDDDLDLDDLDDD